MRLRFWQQAERVAEVMATGGYSLLEGGFKLGQRVLTSEGPGTVVNPETVGTQWKQPDGSWIPGVLVRLDSGDIKEANPYRLLGKESERE